MFICVSHNSLPRYKVYIDTYREPPLARVAARTSPLPPYYYKRASMRMLTRLTVLCTGGSGTFGRAGAFGAGKLRVRVSITGLVNHLKMLRVQAAHEAALREQKAAAKRSAMKKNLPPLHLVSLQLHACRRPMCCNRWARARGGGWTSPRTGGRGTRPCPRAQTDWLLQCWCGGSTRSGPTWRSHTLGSGCAGQVAGQECLAHWASLWTRCWT